MTDTVTVPRIDLERILESWNRMDNELLLLDACEEPAPPLKEAIPDTIDRRSHDELSRRLLAS